MIETIAIITVAFSAGFLAGTAWAGRPGGTTGDDPERGR